MRKPRIVILANQSSGIGGAERFYVGLRDALEAQGVDAELLSIFSDESTLESIKRTYLRFYDLDLAGFDGIISTKGPGYAARHPNHVCYLQHTMRVFYDMFEQEFPQPTPYLLEQRALIQRLDTAALSDQRIRRRFVIGEQVRGRLREVNGLDAEVLYQASTLSNFRCGNFDYLFLPGRLHRWKRVDLVIRAMRHVKAPVKLLITGTGEDESMFRREAEGDDRVAFLGRVTDEELLELYGNALAVAFVPVREDFGLVTLEAFHSRKPVITCVDSGEPAVLVRDGVSGFVCAPDPRDIAIRIELLWEDRDRARRMGEAGEASVAEIRWDKTAARLIEAFGYR
jgi:glycosyltransferase involved in cell wall biosynthesis